MLYTYCILIFCKLWVYVHYFMTLCTCATRDCCTETCLNTVWKFHDEIRSEHPTAARVCIVMLVRSVLDGCRRRRWRPADTSFNASVDTTEGWWVKADERLLWSNPPPTTCVSSHQKRLRYMKKGTSKLLCVLRQTRINGSFNPGGLDNQKEKKKGRLSSVRDSLLTHGSGPVCLHMCSSESSVFSLKYNSKLWALSLFS